MPEMIADRLALLHRLLPSIMNKRVAEVGVLHGDYSAEILKREPGELHLIDPWRHQDDAAYNDINNHEQSKFDLIHANVCARFSLNRNVYIHRQFSHQFCRQNSAIKFDFVYLDGNHSLEGVMADLCMFYPMMNAGGWIAGHDWGSPSPFIGVQQSCIMFEHVTGNAISILTEEPWGSFAIQIKE